MTQCFQRIACAYLVRDSMSGKAPAIGKQRRLLSLIARATATALIALHGLAAAAGFTSVATAPDIYVNHAAVLLPSGQVLVAAGSYSTRSARFDPASNKWTVTAAPLTYRAYYPGALLASGKVLIAGGYGSGGAQASAEIYDPSGNVWVAAAPLPEPRQLHAMTRLPSGKVLVTGGRNSGGRLAGAQLYDPATNAWTSGGALATPRESATAVLLASGKVLVIGGAGDTGHLKSAEIYDPATNAWAPVSSMVLGRQYHTATVLASGKVLVVGGSGSIASAELYDPATDTWTGAGTLARGRSNHTATLLPSGKVLVTGGEPYTATAEVYDPSTNLWTSAGSLAVPRLNHTATMLPSGSVLIVGGQSTSGVPLDSAEIFDPSAAVLSTGASLPTTLIHHTATLLHSGKVLVAGGASVSPPALSSAHLLDPSNGTWSTVAPMNLARYMHSATLLFDGKVLVTGGIDAIGEFVASAEVYDPVTNSWTVLPTLASPRAFHTATLLPSGWVLMSGGVNANGTVASAELFDPVTWGWLPGAAPLTPRSGHSATLLSSGKVLVAGGHNPGPLTSAEIYDPATNSWAATASLGVARDGHSASLLPSGKVLVAGGFDGSYLASVEAFDPATNAWSPAAALPIPSKDHRASVTPSGMVIVTGGLASNVLDAVQRYDPATGVWTVLPSLAGARVYHTATQLLDGRIVVTGGWRSGHLASVEFLDTGLGFDALRRPELLTVIDPIHLGSPQDLTGVRFTGDSEGSGGNTSNTSATNHPVVQLRRLENAEIRWLTPDASMGFTGSTWRSTNVVGATPGAHAMTIFVNGIPSVSEVVDVQAIGATASITSSMNPSTFGQVVTFNAIVTGSSPTGWVSFMDGVATQIAGCALVPLSAGQASCTTGALGVGSHEIHAYYSGDARNQGAIGGGFAQVTQVVTGSSTPASIEIVSGSGQSTQVGTPFGQPLVVLVRDTGGNPMPGVTVAFTVESQGGSATLSTIAATTDGAGRAQVNATATGSMGQIDVYAAATGVGVPARFTLTAVTGPPASIAVEGIASQSARVNGPYLRFLARVTDAYGNPVYLATVVFTAPGIGASAMLPGGGTTFTAQSSDSGIAELPPFSANAIAGGYSIVATVAGVAIPATFSLTNLAGPAAQIAFAGGAPQATGTGTPFPQAIVAKVTDASGNAVSGATVVFKVPAGEPSATLTGTSAAGTDVFETTAADGTAVVTAVAGNSPGTYTIRIVLPVLETAQGQASSTLTNLGGPAAVSFIGGSPQSAVAGSAFARPLVIKVSDGAGVGVQGVTVALTAPASGASAVLSQSSGVTDALGEFMLGATANSSAGAYSISALASGVPQPASGFLLNTLGKSGALAAGGSHTCALTVSGGVKCWGANFNGQLGDNSVTQQSTPVDVWGLASGVVAVAAGNAHTCALTSAGGVKCWGRNLEGQLGDSSITQRTAPVDVTGLTSGVVAVAAGSEHTCALTTGGGVKCWGYNDYGQMGDGSYVRRITPGDVSGLTSGVVAVGAGSAHTCALLSGGGVKCWGSNVHGQLGIGSFSRDNNVPAEVAGMASGIVAVAAGGGHTCALTSGSGVKCWGLNGSGQLGNSSADRASAPVEVSGLSSGIVGISTGFQHTCALTTGGGAKCWGSNGGGQLGDGSTTESSTPVDVLGLTSGVVAVTAGGGHTCALTSGDGIKCWGGNGAGEVGNGTLTITPIPAFVYGFPGSPAVITASGGDLQSASIDTDFTRKLQATVLDSTNAPVAGVMVTFALPATGAAGSFNTAGNPLQAISITDAMGVATAPWFIRANAIVGAWQATARIGALPPATFNLTNVAGAPASILASDGTPQTTFTSTLFGEVLQATVKDALGNPVVGATVTFKTPSTGASATFPGALRTVTAVTDSVGIASSPALTANATAGTFNATVQLGALNATYALTSIPRSGATIMPTVGTPQTAVVNTPYGAQLVAVVKDASNNPVPGITVTFTLPGGTGATGSFATGGTTRVEVSDVSGIVTSPVVIANTKKGAFVATARATGIAVPASFSLTNLPDVPAAITPRVGAQAATVYTDFARALSVQVKDQFGNTIPGANVAFALPASAATAGFAPGGAGGQNTAVVTDASGIATTSLLTANDTVGSYQATAMVAALPAATFAMTNRIGTGAAASIIGGTPQSIVAGGTFAQPLSLVVRDSLGRTIEGAKVTFSLPTGTLSGTFPGAASSAVAYTDASGIAVSPPIMAKTRSGGFNGRAVVAGISGTINFPLTVLPDVAFKVTTTVGAQSAPVGTTFTRAPSLYVTDQFNNRVPGVPVTFTFFGTGQSGTFGPPVNGNVAVIASDANGVATAPAVTANYSVGPYQVRGAAAGVAVPGTFSMTNTVGSGATIAATGGGAQTTQVNTLFPLPLKATITTAGGTPITGVFVTFTVATMRATFPGGLGTATVPTGANGEAVSPPLTAAGASAAYTATARATGVTGSVTFGLTSQ